MSAGSTGCAQIVADRVAQIALPRPASSSPRRDRREVLVGRADQSEILLDTEWRSRRDRPRSGRYSCGRARRAAARRCGCPSPAGRAAAPLRQRHRAGPATRTGPAAFTSTRALAASPPSSVSCHTPSACRAPTQRVRVRMSAPRAAASRAFSTTSRASSTQQSEYSKPRVNSGRSGAPAGSVRRSSERVPAGSRARPDGRTGTARAGSATAAAAPHGAAARSASGGSRCGAARSSTSRSASDSRTRRNA